MRNGRVVCLFVSTLVLLTGALAAIPAQAQQYDESLFKAMSWRSIGPPRGGRAIAVTGVPDDIRTYYFGAVAGGVWKSTDAGNTWNPIFDGQSIGGIGAIAVAPSDANVLYVGTGEACLRGNITHGNGVYRSTDAGKTWTHLGLDDTRHIGRVLVHPTNPDLVYVAALGHVFGPNEERGVFRSTDGGKTWEKVLYVSDKAGAIDISYAPTNPRILFAGFWQVHRKTWTLESGGPDSGLYKSTDGGDTWTKLEGNGLPEKTMGKIGVSVSGANPDRVWALIEARDGGLFRSEDGGENWRRVNSDQRFRQRAFYYTHVIADPQSENTVYVLNTGFYKSTDGGKTFESSRVPHGDNHGLWINPNHPEVMINANDGGANVSLNGAKTWSRQDTQPTAQFYHVITDNQFPYRVYGAQQDNSTVSISSQSTPAFGRTGPEFYSVGGCESGYIAPHPADPNIAYAGCYGGSITRFDRRSGQSQQVMAWPENPMGAGAGELKHRWQWTAPILFSPHDSNVIYHAAEVLFKSTTEGMNWEIISPDLTYNDKSKQGPSGGPITHDNTSVEYYGTIFTVVESPHKLGEIWAGTDDGRVWLTRNGGCAETSCWEEITPKAVVQDSKISILEVSPHSGSTAYIAVDRHKVDDYKPYIYKSSNYGKSWKLLTDGSNGIPNGTFVRTVREDPVRKGLLVAGTETGVYVSFNDGGQWQPLQLNLPVTPIHDLVIKNDDVVVATHGRSFWILDNITPLRQLNDKVADAGVHLYNPQVAYRTRRGSAIVHYYLKEKAEKPITLEILDSEGNVVRKFTSREDGREPESPFARFFGFGRSGRLKTDAGMNLFRWNLRLENPVRVRGAVMWGGGGSGQTILPGDYQVKLTVDGESYTAALTLKLDPRIKTPAADLAKQFALVKQINAEVNRAHTAMNRIRDLRNQINDIQKRIGKDKNNKAIVTAGKDLVKKISAIEGDIHQVKAKSNQDVLNFPIKINNKLTLLASTVMGADTAPTEQAYAVFEDLKTRLAVQLEKWQTIEGGDLRAFNQLVRERDIPAVVLAASDDDRN